MATTAIVGGLIAAGVAAGGTYLASKGEQKAVGEANRTSVWLERQRMAYEERQAQMATGQIPNASGYRQSVTPGMAGNFEENIWGSINNTAISSLGGYDPFQIIENNNLGDLYRISSGNTSFSELSEILRNAATPEEVANIKTSLSNAGRVDLVQVVDTLASGTPEQIGELETVYENRQRLRQMDDSELFQEIATGDLSKYFVKGSSGGIDVVGNTKDILQFDPIYQVFKGIGIDPIDKVAGMLGIGGSNKSADERVKETVGYISSYLATGGTVDELKAMALGGATPWKPGGDEQGSQIVQGLMQPFNALKEQQEEYQSVIPTPTEFVESYADQFPESSVAAQVDEAKAQGAVENERFNQAQENLNPGINAGEEFVSDLASGGGANRRNELFDNLATENLSGAQNASQQFVTNADNLNQAQLSGADAVAAATANIGAIANQTQGSIAGAVENQGATAAEGGERIAGALGNLSNINTQVGNQIGGAYDAKANARLRVGGMEFDALQNQGRAALDAGIAEGAARRREGDVAIQGAGWVNDAFNRQADETRAGFGNYAEGLITGAKNVNRAQSGAINEGLSETIGQRKAEQSMAGMRGGSSTDNNFLLGATTGARLQQRADSAQRLTDATNTGNLAIAGAGERAGGYEVQGAKALESGYNTGANLYTQGTDREAAGYRDMFGYNTQATRTWGDAELGANDDTIQGARERGQGQLVGAGYNVDAAKALTQGYTDQAGLQTQAERERAAGQMQQAGVSVDVANILSSANFDTVQRKGDATLAAIERLSDANIRNAQGQILINDQNTQERLNALDVAGRQLLSAYQSGELSKQEAWSIYKYIGEALSGFMINNTPLVDGPDPQIFVGGNNQMAAGNAMAAFGSSIGSFMQAFA